MRDKIDPTFLVSRRVDLEYPDQEIFCRVQRLQCERISFNPDLPYYSRQFVADIIIQADGATPILFRQNDLGANVILCDEVLQEPFDKVSGDGRKFFLSRGPPLLQGAQGNDCTRFLLLARFNLFVNDFYAAIWHRHRLYNASAL